ncbi:MAG TPA: ABC transporter permease, partial [Acidimicrobiia bacterium]|nr:ABC transporter permease [Acidimicrobiia bacterium]
MTRLAVEPSRDQTDPGTVTVDARRRRLPRWALGLIVPVVIIALWELGAATGAISTRLIPPPSAIAET